jgi:hypothetical protein
VGLFNIAPASCQPFGTWNFELVSGFLENLCTPGLGHEAGHSPPSSAKVKNE